MSAEVLNKPQEKRHFPPKNVHDSDFYTWTQNQVALLRTGQFIELDIPNLIEELEDMGRSEHRALENRLAVLLMHLLKWRYQPAQQSSSWRATIKGQRKGITQLLRKNPGLEPACNAAMFDAYELAMFDAMRETGLEETDFPSRCPWEFREIVDDNFWPISTSGISNE